MDQRAWPGTVGEMRERWRRAPRQVRRLAVYCYAALVPVVVAQVIAAAALVRRVTAMAESMAGDPFATLTGEGVGAPTVSYSALERFSSGFAMSGAASFAVLALFAGTWLVTPYRNRSYRALIWSVMAQAALVGWSIIGLLTGSKVLDASVVGILATVVVTIPALLLAREETVRAWSVRFEPPPPPLPGQPRL